MSTGTIIVPGPQIKKRIEATAVKIAANPKLIEVLQSSEEHKAKFTFLNSDDLFYPYYIHRLQEEKSGGGGGKSSSSSKNNQGSTQQHGDDGDRRPVGGQDEDEDAVPLPAAANEGATDTAAAPVKVDPHPNQYSLGLDAGLDSIPQLELSVILEYVAREVKYGTEFTSRFRSSPLISQPMFEFLNPQSSRHAFYRNALGVYRRIQSACSGEDSLEAMLDKLDLYTDHNYVMRICNESADAIRAQQEQEAQRVAATSASKFIDYDWHNFIVVEEFAAMDLGLDADGAAASNKQQQATNAPPIPKKENTIGMFGVVPQQPQQIMAFDDSTGELVSLEDAHQHVKASNRALAANNSGVEVERQKRPRDDGLATAAESANYLAGPR